MCTGQVPYVYWVVAYLETCPLCELSGLPFLSLAGSLRVLDEMSLYRCEYRVEMQVSYVWICMDMY